MISKSLRGRKSTTNANIRVRDKARENRVALWQVAEEYGLSESKFSIMLRHELSEDTQNELISIIDRIADKRHDEHKRTITVDPVEEWLLNHYEVGNEYQNKVIDSLISLYRAERKDNG